MPDLEAAGDQSVFRFLHRIVLDFRPVGIAEKAAMQKGEVGKIEVILDDPGRLGPERVIGGADGPGRIVIRRDLHFRDVSRRFPEADPHDPVLLPCGVGEGARLFRDGAAGVGRDAGALAALIILPAMIGTDNAALLDRAEGKLGPAMDAEILPGHDLPAGFPEDHVFPKNADAFGAAFLQLIGRAGHIPLIFQYRIINHRLVPS